MYASTRAPLPPRRRLVHLPDLRLGPRPERLHRGVTHSICTLEFEVHRPLYDWYLDQLGVHHPSRSSSPASTSAIPSSASAPARARRGRPRQRLGRPAHADHNRLPPPRLHARVHRQFRGHHRRRQGQQPRRPAAARDVRPRAPEPDRPPGHGRLRPLKVVITNYPTGRSRSSRPSTTRGPLGRDAPGPLLARAWIERDDFMENPPPKFYRLTPGKEVRLRYAYFIKCEEASRTRPATSSSSAAPMTRRRAAATPPDGRKVKATLHWSRPGTPSTPRSASTIRCSRSATR